MKKLINLFNVKCLKGKPNMMYHFVWFILSEAIGIMFLLGLSIHLLDFSLGLFIGIVALVVGSIVLPFFQILFNLVFGCFPKYFSVLALPFYIIMIIGNIFGEVNLLSEYGYIYPLLVSIVLSLFGYINIKTSFKAKKEVETAQDQDLYNLIFIIAY